MKPDVTVKLRDALRERLAIIADEESRKDEVAHVARLQAISERIDVLQNTLPPPVDAQLAHFLQRKSYQKALAYLDQNESDQSASGRNRG